MVTFCFTCQVDLVSAFIYVGEVLLYSLSWVCKQILFGNAGPWPWSACCHASVLSVSWGCFGCAGLAQQDKVDPAHPGFTMVHCVAVLASGGEPPHAAAVGVSQLLCCFKTNRPSRRKVTDGFVFKGLQLIFRSEKCLSVPWRISARQQYHLIFSVIASSCSVMLMGWKWANNSTKTR